MSLNIMVIDNFDSFTYNLVQYLAELGADITVRRNDAVDIDETMDRFYAGVMVSPGPGNPDSAGASLAVVHAAMQQSKPLLGVCLGHQTIVQACGGTIVRAQAIMHGKTSLVTHDGTGVFRNIPSPYTVVRYHSLAAEQSSLPECLRVTARTDDQEIMGVRHTSLPIEGVQFHPESIGSEHGYDLLKNWLEELPDD